MSAIPPVTSFRESSVKHNPIEKISSGRNLAILGHVFTFISPDQFTDNIRRVSHCWKQTSMSPKVIKGQLQNCNYLGETQLAKSFLSLWLSKKEYHANPLMIRLFFRFQKQKNIERGFYYHLALNLLKTNRIAGGFIYSINGVSLIDMTMEEFTKAGEVFLSLINCHRDPDFDPFIKMLAHRSVQTYIQELEDNSPSFIDLCTIRHKLLSNLNKKIDAEAYPMPFLTKNALMMMLSLFLQAEADKQRLSSKKVK